MPVNLQHSDHLLLKIEILKAHGIDFTTEKIDRIIRFPDKLEMGFKDRLIVQNKVGLETWRKNAGNNGLSWKDAKV